MWQAREKLLNAYEKSQRMSGDTDGAYHELASLMLPMSKIDNLVDQIYGRKAPSLTGAVLEKVENETMTSQGQSGVISVGHFGVICLEEFRLYFEKPFPMVPARDPRKEMKRIKDEGVRESCAFAPSSER